MLAKASDRSFDHVETVAIAIKAINDSQRHMGILHRLGTGELKFLHLAWHHKLAEDAPKPSYLWVSPALPRARARQVAARCRQLTRANGRYIPYGFSPPTDCFDSQTGIYLFGSTRNGLTCASFVLAVFAWAEIHLLDYKTWLSRGDDEVWQTMIVEALQQCGATEHAQAISADVGCVRFRPEEVAAGAAVYPPAGSFIPTVILAHRFIASINEAAGFGVANT